MRTPRESFLLSGKAAVWKKVVESVPEMDAACEYALLEMAADITDPLNPTGLAQIIGARRVLEILRTIHEPLKEPAKEKRQTIYRHP